MSEWAVLLHLHFIKVGFVCTLRSVEKLVSLISPIQVCAAEHVMVFRVSSLKQGIQIPHYCLEQGVFLDRKPLKECGAWR